MTYNVCILPSAWEDLKQIEDYYSIKFGPASGLKVVEQILDTIDQLEEFPDLGSRTPDEWLNEMGYHMVISGDFVAFHRVIDTNVFIYHVANVKRDYSKLF